MYRGNKDLFINEYRNELSDRLIKGGYETNAETKIVELLKIRFGDKALQNCEIMLKDISDSKFINQNIHEKISSKEPLDVKIISRNYWPTSAQETADVKEQAKLHPLIQDMQKEFENEYRKLKAPRRLIWQPSLGTIDIIVTLGEQDHPVTTNPVDGSILLYFGESDQWSISSLAEVVNLTPETCLKKCQTWAKNGYLKQLDDELFELQTELTPMNAMMDQDGGSGGESRQQLMRAYDSMVTQMLETMEALELGRIHSMLTMVVMDPMPTYDYDTQELRAYLQELIEEGTLLLDGGLYRLKQ
jgi:anaphase-promoting complex subunit 2